jgi:hypothetical protein
MPRAKDSLVRPRTTTRQRRRFPVHAPRTAPAIAALAVLAALVGGFALGVLLAAFASAFA